MRAPATSRALTAPVGGWDTRNALADMPPENAVILDNWFPETDKVTLRRGSASHATGMTGAVESLLMYTPLTGTGEMFACNGGNVYDVTAAGAVGAAVASGLSNDRFQQVQIGTAGGQFLIAMNGEDTPLLYDGTTWGNTTFTGPTVTNLIWCNLHQRRLWFGEKQSLSAWYLAVNAIAGAATEFSLAGIAKLGGYIMGMGTWTRDAGDGSDDVAVFITSEGEAIVYQGTDPSAASTWALVGVFRIGKPIGRRSIIKAGGDLIFITEDGFVSAATILILDRSQTEKVAISSQINQAVNSSVQNYRTLFGWECFIYPTGKMLIFNIPQSSVTSHQYVFNTITKAPSRFKGLNALCWGQKGNVAFYGGTDGIVHQFDTGTADSGTAIEGDALQAFSYFGSPGKKKAFKSVQPIFESKGDPSAALDLNVDFQIAKPTGVSTPSPTSSARWGISKWGIGVWGTDGLIYKQWRGVRGVGRAASLRVRVSTTTARPSWISTNFVFVPGGMM